MNGGSSDSVYSRYNMQLKYTWYIHIIWAILPAFLAKCYIPITTF